MRVWDTDPRNLCDKHLRAQHAEIHFAINVIEHGWRTRWKDVERFRRHKAGLGWLGFIHDATVSTLQSRGKFLAHKTHVDYLPLYYPKHWMTFDPPYWMPNLSTYGYPPTELNEGTPWERDKVSEEWYKAHHHDWTRQLAKEARSE